MQAITKHLKRFKRAERGISTVIVATLSLVLVVIIVGNVVLSSYQMNQVDWEKMQENMNLSIVSYNGNSPWSSALNAYNINNGSLVSGTYSGTQQFGDGNFETFREENPLTNTSLNPSGITLDGSTTQLSGSVSDLASSNGVSMSFGSYVSSSSGQNLTAHKETTSIAGTTYNTSKVANADTTGATLSTSLAGARSLLDKSVYSLQGVPSIPASTWTMYYRAWKDTGASVPTNSPGSTSGGWTNPTNAYADGGSYASSISNGTNQVYGGYGFAIPGGVSINQVRVRLDAYVSGGDGNDKILLEVSVDGSNWFATTQLQTLTSSETTYWVDVTGWTSWTPETVNSIQTRVTQIRSGSSTDEVRLDWIPVEVIYPTSTTDTNPASSVSPTFGGWSNPTYAYASDSYSASSSTNGRQQTYAGYGYSIPSGATITQIRVRLDAWVTGSYEQNDDIRVEVSADGGSTWLATTQTISPTTSEVTYWIDVTSSTSWAPANVNSDNIEVRVTQVRSGSYTDTVRLDYIPVEVSFTTPTVVTQSASTDPNPWISPTNAYADGGSYATSGYYGGEQQVYGGYGFAIPAGAQVAQVRVRLDAWVSGDDVVALQVSGDGGSTWFTTTQTIVPTTSEATYWVDVTGWTSWTPTNVNNDNVKVRVTHVRVGGLGYVYLDWIPIEVSYTIPATAHIDADILIRQSNGAIRSTIATNVASSGVLTSTAQTLSGTYSWSGYTVVDQSDYLEIDYYADVTVAGNVNAYLVIDNQSLPSADQTKAANVMLPSQYTVQVEATGSVTFQSWETLLWSMNSGFTAASVSTTLQAYNYNSGQYPSSGDGYISYTSSATPNANDTKTQSITANPTYYAGSGAWKIRITGITGSPFNLTLDWVEYKRVVPNLYYLDISNSFILNLDTYPAKHISNLTLQVAYNVSDTGTRWLVKAYNWTTSNFSNAGFNDTVGSQPAGIGQWNNYTLSVPVGYMAANGTVLIKFLNAAADGVQTNVGVDFLGVWAVMDGGQDWLVENSSPETIHLVAVWITNSTQHQRYDKDMFISAGETSDSLFTGLSMPTGSIVVKAVTERGTVAILSVG